MATGVNREGKREVLGIDVGTSEDGAFWLAFLRSLVARGLSGVQLVTSDAHQGLKDAIATVFGEACWQRCRTHFMTNLLSKVPKRAQPWVATMIRTIYQQPSPEEVHAQHQRVVAQLEERFPEVAGRLEEAGPDILAFTAFPVAHWKQVVVEQPAGAAEQGDQAPHGRGGHLPESGRRPAPRRRGVGRAARRVAGRPALSRRACLGRGDRRPHRGSDVAARRGGLIRPRG